MPSPVGEGGMPDEGDRNHGCKPDRVNGCKKQIRQHIRHLFSPFQSKVHGNLLTNTVKITSDLFVGKP